MGTNLKKTQWKTAAGLFQFQGLWTNASITDSGHGPVGKHKITGAKEYWREVKKKWNGIWGENSQCNLYDKYFQSNKTKKSHGHTEFCLQKKTKNVLVEEVGLLLFIMYFLSWWHFSEPASLSWAGEDHRVKHWSKMPGIRIVKDHVSVSILNWTPPWLPGPELFSNLKPDRN